MTCKEKPPTFSGTIRMRVIFREKNAARVSKSGTLNPLRASWIVNSNIAGNPS